MINLNDILKKLSTEAGITMTTLAANIGVSKQYLSEITTKNRNISADKFVKIFNYFDNIFNEKSKKLNFRWFLTGEGKMFIDDYNEPNNVVTVKLKKGQLLKIEYEDN